jgi:hypothetical protein
MFSLLFFAFFQGTWYYQQVNLLAMFFAGLVLALLPYHLEKKSDKFLAFPLVIIPAARFLAFLLGIF